jgi:hypothetical protein
MKLSEKEDYVRHWYWLQQRNNKIYSQKKNEANDIQILTQLAGWQLSPMRKRFGTGWVIYMDEWEYYNCCYSDEVAQLPILTVG